MEFWIFGNEDLPQDSTPIHLIPRLQAAFPEHTFVLKDPLDEWEPMPEHLRVIDTIVGLYDVNEYTDLEGFAQAPSVTMHDFDALSQLRFLQKLGKLKKITLYGVPDTLTEDQAFSQLEMRLRQLSA